jgi:hypothetical protein
VPSLFDSDLRLQVPFDRRDADASELETLELRFVLGLIRAVEVDGIAAADLLRRKSLPRNLRTRRGPSHYPSAASGVERRFSRFVASNIAPL